MEDSYLRGKTKLILVHQSNPSAHWDHTANSWWIGDSVTYQWTDSKNRPVSDWMDLDHALQWIIQYDERNIRT